LFFAFAALAAFQRIESSAHYVSDTLAGAAIACVIVGLCFDTRVFGTAFSRFEESREGNKQGQEVLCSTPVSDGA
jgi:hypothetical protein